MALEQDAPAPKFTRTPTVSVDEKPEAGSLWSHVLHAQLGRGDGSPKKPLKDLCTPFLHFNLSMLGRSWPQPWNRQDLLRQHPPCKCLPSRSPASARLCFWSCSNTLELAVEALEPDV